MKRDLWFTMIRVIIVAALVGAALWMLAVAYAPQPPAPLLVQRELLCPPPLQAAERPEPIAAPQVACAVQPTAMQLPQRNPVIAAPEQRTVVIKKDEKRAAPKKQSVRPMARSNRAPVRGKTETTIRHAPATHADRSSPLLPTLAQSGFGQSPFGDMHGQ